MFAASQTKKTYTDAIGSGTRTRLLLSNRETDCGGKNFSPQETLPSMSTSSPLPLPSMVRPKRPMRSCQSIRDTPQRHPVDSPGRWSSRRDESRPRRFLQVELSFHERRLPYRVCSERSQPGVPESSPCREESYAPIRFGGGFHVYLDLGCLEITPWQRSERYLKRDLHGYIRYTAAALGRRSDRSRCVRDGLLSGEAYDA